MATGVVTNGRGAASNGRPTIVNGRPTRRRGEPTWEIARAFPLQGHWTEDEYLSFEAKCENQMVELVDGFLEFLPMPVPRHRRIATFTFLQLHAYSERVGGWEVMTAPCPVRLRDGEMREPDIFVVKPGRIKNPDEPPDGADLAVEVPSPGKENRERDLRTKRRAYAKAKIAEYWIIDLETGSITVLTLVGKSYKVHGKFRPGQQATSKLLAGFTLDVAAVFAAGRGK